MDNPKTKESKERCMTYVPKKGMYNFVGDFKGEKIQINFKNQYKRILKEKGLIDVSVSEVKSVREKQLKMESKHDLGKLEHRIRDQVAKDGLNKHLDPLMNMTFKQPKERERITLR